MNNLKVTKMDNMKKEEVVIREMNQLEQYGAMAYLHQLVNDFHEVVYGESYTTLEDIDNNTFYCNKKLHINEGELVFLDNGEEVVIDCVFMLEGSKNDLWGYAYKFKDESEVEPEMFLVRI